ncbi:hypothetical protein CENSYa_1554 [Cenarchaeum symbiosum A]|uniref:Late embryogenesis abundant protein LEA-2 subgroup domain-containing protein n=1 Tax=Cenarchaeum symbiosum (strain A) TaxID=414004 RepID=A0RXV9_CENSY|nr:hypothetical protein CENSYa_1554 [Cenarchaeum symbiosum A]
MGGFVWYASTDNPELEKVEVVLQDVNVLDVNRIEDNARLQVTFLVSNPSAKTFTVPVLSYDLYADGEHIGAGVYSTEDVAMPGRAAFYAGAEIPLKNIFRLSSNAVDSALYDSIIAGESLNYSASGRITVETAWSIVEKDF